MTIRSKYLEAIKSLNDWATVSEWAIKFCELYPELLEKADKEAKKHKKPSTGIREIAARISSGIASGHYIGLIEINDSERPKKSNILNLIERKNIRNKN